MSLSEYPIVRDIVRHVEPQNTLQLLFYSWERSGGGIVCMSGAYMMIHYRAQTEKLSRIRMSLIARRARCICGLSSKEQTRRNCEQTDEVGIEFPFFFLFLSVLVFCL